MELSLCRVMVSPRVDARQVEAKGIFPGAEVVRGKNWKFGDQDGERERENECEQGKYFNLLVCVPIQQEVQVQLAE